MIQAILYGGIGEQDVYVTERIVGKTITGNQWLTFLCPYLSAKYLSYLEFHIADQCNLNCKACEHYSGLVDEPRYPAFGRFAKDFNTNLPEDGAIDLYAPGLTTEMIKAKLLQPFERCCYCRDAISVDWAQIKKPSLLSDWLVEEN